VLRTARGAEALAQKKEFHLNTDTKRAAGMFANKSGRKITDLLSPSRVDAESAPAKKEVAAKAKGALGRRFDSQSSFDIMCAHQLQEA
jgi:hypothetical protein